MILLCDFYRAHTKTDRKNGGNDGRKEILDMLVEREMNPGRRYCLLFFSAVLHLPKVTYAPTQVSDILVPSHTYTTSTTVSLVMTNVHTNTPVLLATASLTVHADAHARTRGLFFSRQSH